MTDKMKAAGELSLGELQVEEEKEPSMKNKVWLFLGGREKGTKRRGNPAARRLHAVKCPQQEYFCARAL